MVPTMDSVLCAEVAWTVVQWLYVVYGVHGVYLWVWQPQNRGGEVVVVFCWRGLAVLGGLAGARGGGGGGGGRYQLPSKCYRWDLFQRHLKQSAKPTVPLWHRFQQWYRLQFGRGRGSMR